VLTPSSRSNKTIALYSFYPACRLLDSLSALKIEAVSSSETSANFYQTTQHNSITKVSTVLATRCLVE
jgi:hypothetical protein